MQGCLSAGTTTGMPPLCTHLLRTIMKVSDEPRNWMLTQGAAPTCMAHQPGRQRDSQSRPGGQPWRQPTLQGAGCERAATPPHQSPGTTQPGHILAASRPPTRMAAPNRSIHRKSAARLRKLPSSSDLEYLTRKNMWKKKSRPGRRGADGLGWVVGTRALERLCLMASSRMEQGCTGVLHSHNGWWDPAPQPEQAQGGRTGAAYVNVQPV